MAEQGDEQGLPPQDDGKSMMSDVMQILLSHFESEPEITDTNTMSNLNLPVDNAQHFVAPEYLPEQQPPVEKAGTSEMLCVANSDLQSGYGRIDSFSCGDYQVASQTSPEGVTQYPECSSGPVCDPTLSTNSCASDPQNKPRINILKISKNVRFRYDSETKTTKTDGNSDKVETSSLGKIELVNVYSKFQLKICLVADLAGNPHANKLRLKRTSKKGYSQCGDFIILEDHQKEKQKSYDLPSCDIMRAKRGSSALAAALDCRRVRIKFECYVRDQLVAQEISDEIIHLKGKNDTTLVHVNPFKTRFSDQVEVTLLGNNITKKHKVLFYNKKTGEAICSPVVPHIFHKDSAVVIKTPVLAMRSKDQTSDLECKIVLCSEKSDESDSVDFTFIPDRILRPEKRKHEEESKPEDPKKKLRDKILSGQSSKLNSVLQADSGADGGDEEEPRLDDNIHQIAFDVAHGQIQFDERLCQRLGVCDAAMLQRDDGDCTPLALAITSGKLDIAEAFLSQMPPQLANELLKEQRLTDAYVTHLLLMAFWPDREPPLSLLTTLLRAGSDLEALDAEGNSLLHLLIRNEKHEALESILSSKDEEPFSKITAVLDHTNRAGFAPLHEAVYRHQLHAVKALLSAGANVNITARNSRFTCLHYAALDSDPEFAVEVTRLLLDGPGLKINERTLEGKTATDIADERENQKLLNFLKNNGGIHLFETSSEDEEEDLEEHGAAAGAAAAKESVSLEEAHQQLLEALSPEDLCALGRELLSAAQNRLLQHAADPGAVFLRLLASARRKGEVVDLAAALRRLGRTELAELVASARIT